MFRKKEVENLLKSYGQPITFQTYTEGTYNPTTGTTSTSSDVPRTVIGYFYNYTLEEMASNSIEAGMRKLLLSTVDVEGLTVPEPKIDDKFVAATGDKVSVVKVEKIYSKSQVMAFIVGVKE